jgi:hypothetical protein
MKGSSKVEGLALDRHLVLLHRFQQRRLRARGRPAELIRQHDVGEDRPRHKRRLPLVV